MSPPRRTPLASNPNAANSPLRGQPLLANTKQRIPYAYYNQRAEAYGQPPSKRQALENGASRPVVSPSRARSHLAIQRPAASAASYPAQSGSSMPRQLAHRDRSRQPVPARATHEPDNEAWRKHYTAKFPSMVFYLDGIPDDIKAKLDKRIAYLGARQEPFFSNVVTHVITTRPIPPVPSEGAVGSTQYAPEPAPEPLKQQEAVEQQPETINPSLLNRTTAVRRKLLFDFRQASAASQSASGNAAAKRAKPRNNDVLNKSREMGKKIWSLDKFLTMLSVLLDTGSHSTSKSTTIVRGHTGASKSLHEPSLVQLLHNERVNGPSDRDPAADIRDLIYFKGPYIYVWDMDERTRPLMVREYPKATDKSDGEWPQFRSVKQGRCPFLEESEARERRQRRRDRDAARAAARVATHQNIPVARVNQVLTATRTNDVPTATKANVAPLRQSALVATQREIASPQPPPTVRSVTGKRTLSEMQQGQNRVSLPAAAAFNPAKAMLSKAHSAAADMAGQPSHLFLNRGGPMNRLLFGGEPVASGVQPSNLTSAIRSQMVSSTAGVHGAKAGTSKEIYGLQRQVMKKAQPVLHDAGSRRLVDVGADAAPNVSVSTATCRQPTTTSTTTTVNTATTAKTTATQQPGTTQVGTVQTKETQPARADAKSEKDVKLGFCENCMERFESFEEHIKTRTHRKFAENEDHWVELDDLLSCLARRPKYSSMMIEEGSQYSWCPPKSRP